MKKQYMQPEWRITVLEENFVTTSTEITFKYDGDGFLNSNKFVNWF